MGYTKPRVVTREYLEAQPLPTHGKSYTVIPHVRVIDTTKKMLKNQRCKGGSVDGSAVVLSVTASAPPSKQDQSSSSSGQFEKNGSITSWKNFITP